MRLCFEGHNEVYAVEQTLMALLPEERPVYGGDDPNWAGVSLTQEGDRAAAVTDAVSPEKTPPMETSMPQSISLP